MSSPKYRDVEPRPGPTPGPVLPPPPEPVEHVVPRMAATAARIEPPIVWRVREVELEALCAWLVPRLRRDHPALNEAAFVAMLKHAVGDRRMCFARTPNTCGLFEAVYYPVMDPAPDVAERWFRSTLPAHEEQIDLYRFVRDWAVSIGARQFDIDRDSDAAMVLHVVPALHEPLRGFMVKKRSIYFAPLRV